MLKQLYLPGQSTPFTVATLYARVSGQEIDYKGTQQKKDVKVSGSGTISKCKLASTCIVLKVFYSFKTPFVPFFKRKQQSQRIHQEIQLI
jgi:hypothetical protein